MKQKELELSIVMLYYQQKKSIHAIAKELGVHRSVVTRVLKKYDVEHEGTATRSGSSRSRITDAYESLILTTLEENPKVSARRLFRMARERGYKGGESQFRQRVSELRGKKKPEAFLQLLSLPGEVMQVDWADFGQITVQGGTRRLYAAVFVLCYSRAIYATFRFDCKTSTLLDAQQEAFEWFRGVPMTCLYDNMKSVVIARPTPRTAIYNEDILRYSDFFNFQVKVTGVRKPHHKGRVERAIQYLRSSFFPGIKWKTLAELNEQALQWCQQISLERKWQDDTTFSVGEKLDEERRRLQPLPQTRYECVETAIGIAKKTHYLHFDCNQYSIPPSGMGQTLSIIASLQQVRIIDGTVLLALHKRSFNKGEKIVDPNHIKEILSVKKGAGKDSLTQLLVSQVPETATLLELLSERAQLRANVLDGLQVLLELYGAYEFKLAVIKTIADSQRQNLPQRIQYYLEASRQQKGLPPLLPLRLLKSV